MGLAEELRQLGVQKLWFVDRAEPAFLAYAQLGRAAENSHALLRGCRRRDRQLLLVPGSHPGHEDPRLLSTLSDPELKANITTYADKLDADELKPLTLSFDLDREFDGRVRRRVRPHMRVLMAIMPF